MKSHCRYVLKKIPPPHVFRHARRHFLASETMKQRLAEIVRLMRLQGLNHLVIYADKEHGGNFEYLAGFIPRFEEALLVVSEKGELTYIMGNENLKLVPFARLSGACLHAPVFSLPNQPMENDRPLSALLARAGVMPGNKTGVVGWKLFTGQQTPLFDVPAFIFEAIKQAAGGAEKVINATGIFISPEYGARRLNRADEIAFYEYGASLASGAMLSALDAVAPGKTEKEIGQLLMADGQPNTVITIAATGDRFTHANLYPSDKLIQRGIRCRLPLVIKGGLTSRSAYVVAAASDLPENVSDWLTRLAIPYYHAVVTWLESLRIGITGGELYAAIEHVLPKEKWNWHLNPGHLVADEEWLCSPIDKHSAIALESGMLLQIDIIPSLPGYGGCSIEDTVALADGALQSRLATDFPVVWARMQSRKTYLSEVLNITLSEDVLLLSNTVGYLRPFLLDKACALIRQ